MNLTRNETNKVCQLLMAIPNSFAFLNSKNVYDKNATWILFEKISLENGVITLKRIPYKKYPKDTGINRDHHWKLANIDMAMNGVIGFAHGEMKWHGVYAKGIRAINKMKHPVRKTLVFHDIKYVVNDSIGATLANLMVFQKEDLYGAVVNFVSGLPKHKQQKLLDELKNKDDCPSCNLDSACDDKDKQE